ncbi:MAG: Uma2 family endonuclease [Kineosporiaceae bacterium]
MSLHGVVMDPAMPVRGLAVAEYDALVASGVLDDQRLELLEGVLVEMDTQSPEHANLTEELAHYLTIGLHVAGRRDLVVRQHSPLSLPPWSEPEPDIAVVEPARTRPGRHPTTAHLLVEVAFSSRGRDLVHKPRVYATAGIPELWVVDLHAEETVVHRDPRPEDGAYGEVRRVPWRAELEILGVAVRLADIAGGPAPERGP